MEPLLVRWQGELQDLEHLGPVYDEFLSKCGDCALFYRTGWLRCLLPVYCPRPIRPVFVSVWRAGRLVGLLPLAREPKPWFKGGVVKLSSLGRIGGSLSSSGPGCLVAAGESIAAVVDALASFLLGTARERWDLLDFTLMPADTEEAVHWHRRFPTGQVMPAAVGNPWLLLPPSADTYMRRFSRTTRDKLRRWHARLESQYSRVEWISTASLSDLELAQIEMLHRNRQALLREAGRSRVSLFDQPEARKAFLALLGWAQITGSGRHYLLKVDGTLASFILGFHAERTYFAHLTAMAPQFASLSPSRLLHLHAIEKEIAHHGTQRFDLLPGDNFLKRQLATDVRPLSDWQVVNPTRRLAAARVGWLRRAQQARQFLTSVRRSGTPAPGRPDTDPITIQRTAAQSKDDYSL